MLLSLSFVKETLRCRGMGGGGMKSYHLRIVYIRVALMCVHMVLRFSISILKSICFIT